MHFLGNLLWGYLLDKAITSYKQSRYQTRNKKYAEKLKVGKADETEWIHGKIPTYCGSCTKPLSRGFIAGWDESIFAIMCLHCYEKYGMELKYVKLYNFETAEESKEEDTPEKREKAQRFQKWLGLR